MPEGGTLRIITANIELGAAETGRQLSAPPGPYVLLSVNDTGAGIPPDVQKRVFEPFFTTKPTGKGTGLGLSTVYGIVKQLGGDLWLRSEPGKGTTFHVYVPRIQGESPEAIQRAKPVALPAGSGTVLLAEDDHALRALTERVLLSAGFTVLPARSGSHALEIARNHAGRIDLAISDVVMPELSGPEFVERLRRKRPGVRVLFVSGYTDDEVMRRGVLAGETAFLQKPFAPEQLLQLDRVTQRREMAKLATAPDYMIGSVHAVTERVRQAGGQPTTAVLHYKPSHSRVPGGPDHHVVTTDRWVVYPFKAGN